MVHGGPRVQAAFAESEGFEKWRENQRSIPEFVSMSLEGFLFVFSKLCARSKSSAKRRSCDRSSWPSLFLAIVGGHEDN